MWEKIEGNIILDDKRSFEVLIIFFKYYYDLTGFDDIHDIIDPASYYDKDVPFEYNFWLYWEESIRSLEKTGPLFIDQISPNLLKQVDATYDCKNFKKTESTETISDKDSYSAMLYFLYDYYKISKDYTLSEIFIGGSYVTQDCPFNYNIWIFWKQAIAKLLSDGPPPNTKLIK